MNVRLRPDSAMQIRPNPASAGFEKPESGTALVQTRSDGEDEDDDDDDDDWYNPHYFTWLVVALTSSSSSCPVLVFMVLRLSWTPG